MCRLLYVKSESDFNIAEHLEKFSEICRNSSEYQGHGWGCSYLLGNEWAHYKSINPVWEDDLSKFASTRLLIAHARSAFQNKDIVIENNMPFHDDKYVFIFNGELRGVKLNSPGRTGAEKIFNFIKKLDKGDIAKALEKGVRIIVDRTAYTKAMNIIITDGVKAYVSSKFNENEEYFTMHFKKNMNQTVICSGVYPGEKGWTEIKNNSTEVFE
jgi:glutamine amidotransferase